MGLPVRAHVSARGPEADGILSRINISNNQPPVPISIPEPVEPTILGQTRSPKQLARYGRGSFESGRYPQAIMWFDKILQVEPENANAKVQIARALTDLGQFDRARPMFEEALGRTPNSPAVLLLVYFRAWCT